VVVVEDKKEKALESAANSEEVCLAKNAVEKKAKGGDGEVGWRKAARKAFNSEGKRYQIQVTGYFLVSNLKGPFVTSLLKVRSTLWCAGKVCMYANM
jgi:hypothetical protein